MEIFISSIIDLIDKHYHQKNINKILFKFNLKTIFDVGAHKGEFSSSLIPSLKSSKIYAFEPQSEIFKQLKKNTKNQETYFYTILLSVTKIKKKN